MQCSWAFVLALSIFFQLGAGHVVDRTWELPKVRGTVGDLSHICLGRQEGDLVPHPLDCNGYFSCARVPTLLYCDQGFQFNENLAVCDLPENANCRSVPPVESASSLADNSELNWWPHKPKPVFVAVDVTSGQPVNPMEKYDPEDIECRHYGAYFLPHPRNCGLYFICAYGHLHRHQCGRGTAWNFEMSECQSRDQAVCYGESRVLESQTDAKTTVKVPTFSSEGPVTVCYVVGSSEYSTLQQFLTDPEITELPPVTPPSPPRAEVNALTCPSAKQSYMSNPEDCSKYYICIGGMPVLTSCPKGLFWDQKSGFCGMEKNVKCFQN